MYTYLALGDSYTIGEQVDAESNFPHQTVALLKERDGLQIAAPKIIAVTGWTTDELSAAIEAANIQENFDFVTLLIGVNNQYRGRSIENYEEEFTILLQRSISFANGNPRRVFVLSIPDWGITPFAEGKDREAITAQIDTYNDTNKTISEAHQCHYLNITKSTRDHGTDETYLTPDKLHYAAKEYKYWAEQLRSLIAGSL